jgi:hypothetical protein
MTWREVLLQIEPTNEEGGETLKYLREEPLYAIIVHHINNNSTSDELVCSACCTSNIRSQAMQPFDHCVFIPELEKCTNCILRKQPCNATSKGGERHTVPLYKQTLTLWHVELEQALMTSFLSSSEDVAAIDEDNGTIDALWYYREGIQIFDDTPYTIRPGKFFKWRDFGAQSAPVDVAPYISPYSKTPESSREGF